jgi:lipoyl(octanoyl) transferase
MTGDRYDLVVVAPGRVEYGRALALQDELVARKIAGDDTDYLLVLEHEAVYTLGRGADEADLLGAPARLSVPVFRVGRGGGVTFHGPGQLVAYPILRLARGGRDVHRYVRTLEAIIVDTCRRLAVEATARPELTGVWVGDGKIASIGIGVRHWITCHGLALNVSTDLAFFNSVVPCRMPEIQVTSLERVLRRPVSLDEVARHLIDCFTVTMSYGSVRRQQAA